MWDDSSNGEGDPAASSGASVRSASRRKRTSFSKEHVELLRRTFETNPYPGISLRETLSQRTGIPESRIQVWFQNRRARTLKGSGPKKALWQPEGSAPDAFSPPHAVASRGPRVPPVLGRPLDGPPHMMRTLEETCYYDQSPPPAYSTSDDHGRYGATYDCRQGPVQEGVSSTPLRGYWSHPGGSQPPPVTPIWCQFSSRQPTFKVPAEPPFYHTPSTFALTTPETPDSGFEEKSLENSPAMDAPPPQEELWGGHTAVEEWGAARYAPLPELSLDDILEELNEEWLQAPPPAHADPPFS